MLDSEQTVLTLAIEYLGIRECGLKLSAHEFLAQRSDQVADDIYRYLMTLDTFDDTFDDQPLSSEDRLLAQRAVEHIRRDILNKNGVAFDKQ